MRDYIAFAVPAFFVFVLKLFRTKRPEHEDGKPRVEEVDQVSTPL